MYLSGRVEHQDEEGKAFQIADKGHPVLHALTSTTGLLEQSEFADNMNVSCLYTSALSEVLERCHDANGRRCPCRT